jgi:nucleoside-diphosphate-sugar epimerase
MLVAVTGGTGFLGRYIVRHLAGLGHRLRCWHRPTSDRGGLEDVAGALDWLPGHLGDEASMTALVRGTDAVVHAALEWQRRPDGRRSGGGDLLREFLETNLMGSLRLIQAARAAGVPRFVFISTCAVHEVILDDRPLDETHPLWPTNHYGAHKGALEKFVHSFGLGEGWPICALRPTGIYGLAHPPSASRWFDLVGRVLGGEPIESARGGKEVHALDVARAVALLLQAEAKAVAGQAFNCYDRYVAEQEVARIARELSGSASAIADVNRGPKHQIATGKIRALGMTFGGEPLLRQTVAELVKAHQLQRTG